MWSEPFTGYFRASPVPGCLPLTSCPVSPLLLAEKQQQYWLEMNVDPYLVFTSFPRSRHGIPVGMNVTLNNSKQQHQLQHPHPTVEWNCKSAPPTPPSSTVTDVCRCGVTISRRYTSTVKTTQTTAGTLQRSN